MTSVRRTAALVAIVTVAAGCGDGGAKTTQERADRAAAPPDGWKTVRNRAAGLTLSVPRKWTARVKSAATLVRSKDKLAVLTIAADRGSQGRQLTATAYARRTLESLPGFEGGERPGVRRVHGSPYKSARVDGSGSLKTTRRPQRIAVVTYRRPRQVMYALVAFFNPKVPARYFEPTFRRVLRSFRAQPPRKR